MKSKKASFAKVLKQFFFGLDLYGEPVMLLIKKQEKYSTPLGSTISLIIVTIITVLFISLAYDMFSHANPTIVSKIEANIDPEAFYFTRDEFFIGLGMADQDALPILNFENEVYFIAILKFCHQDTTVDGSGIPKISQECYHIDMVPCSQTKIDPKHLESLSKERLAYAMCPNAKTWDSVQDQAYINGLGSTKTFGYFNLQVLQCNSSIHKNCANQQLINARMKDGYMQILFKESLLDQGQPGNPYNKVSKTITSTFSQQSQTQIKYNLRHSYFNTLDNFFYLSPQEEVYHALSLVNEVESINAITVSLAELNFFLDDKTERFSRTYQTIFDVFGQVGGFQTFLIFIGGILMNPLTKLSQSIALINTLFTFDDDGETEQNGRGKMQQQQSSISVSPKQPQRRPLKRLLSQKHKQIVVNGTQYLSLMCGGKKRQLIDEGKERIDRQLDISIILQKLFEVEKLKHFLLSDHQLKLFEYIPKPVITIYKSNSVVPLERQKSTIDYFSHDQEVSVKLQLALEAFSFLKDSPQKDDQKLIQMMNSEVKDYFEKSMEDSYPFSARVNNHSMRMKLIHPPTEDLQSPKKEGDIWSDPGRQNP